MSQIKKISEEKLKEKLEELQELIKSDKSMPQNISKYFKLKPNLFDFLIKKNLPHSM